MSVDDLLRRYIEAFRSTGRADPLPYLDQVAGVDRAELAALIDGFLAHAPPPAFDAAAFAAFAADPARQAMVDEALAEEPSLLEFRQRAGLSTADVGARLATDLALGGREEASAVVFHEIETGLVEPRRVRSRVWESLGAIYSEGADRLRRAAEAAFEARGPAGGRVYARGKPAAPAAAAPPPSPGAPEPDEQAVRNAFLVD